MQIETLFSSNDVKEPKEFFIFHNDKYPTWGSSTGSEKTSIYETGKFNRYASIGSYSNELFKDLYEKIENTPTELESRCAYACMLMMLNGIRIGNEGSAEGYESGLKYNEGEIVNTYGVTTLLKEHISFNNNKMMLNFLGKSQVDNKIVIENTLVIDVGKIHKNNNYPIPTWLGINYEILFEFVKESLGKHYSPKDFRTFCANTSAWKFYQDYKDKNGLTKTEANKVIKDIVYRTSLVLNNTPSVCKSSYIDSRMVDWIKDKLIS